MASVQDFTFFNMSRIGNDTCSLNENDLQNVKHRYMPLDVNFLIKSFLERWKPEKIFLIDSEIWPNMFKNLEEKKIPIILINGRITKKSYRRWSNFSYFAREIFSKISLALPQNQESFNYLKKLGVKNIKSVGNLKYFGETTNKASTNLKKLFINRKVFVFFY